MKYNLNKKKYLISLIFISLILFSPIIVLAYDTVYFQIFDSESGEMDHNYYPDGYNSTYIINGTLNMINKFPNETYIDNLENWNLTFNSEYTNSSFSNNNFSSMIKQFKDNFVPNQSEIIMNNGSIVLLQGLDYYDGNFSEFNSSEYSLAYHPGTYSFQEDADGSIPTDWTEVAGDVQVVGAVGNHSKVMVVREQSGKGTNSFSSQEYGTIEWWWYIDSKDFGDSSRYSYFAIEGGGVDAILLRNSQSKWQYKASGGGVWTDVGSVVSHSTWYHHRVDFDCRYEGGYEGLAGPGVRYKFHWIVDRVKICDNISMTNLRASLDKTEFYQEGGNPPTYPSQWADAIGYSWDVGYNVGDNLNTEGGSDALFNFTITKQLSTNENQSINYLNLTYAYNTINYQLVNISLYNFEDSKWDLISSLSSSNNPYYYYVQDNFFNIGTKAYQGVAVDDNYFYAIGNEKIYKFNKTSGEEIINTTAPSQYLGDGCYYDGKIYIVRHDGEGTNAWIAVFNATNLAYIEEISLHTKHMGMPRTITRYNGSWFVVQRNIYPLHLVKYNDSWDEQKYWNFTHFPPTQWVEGIVFVNNSLYVSYHEKHNYIYEYEIVGDNLNYIYTWDVKGVSQGIDWDNTTNQLYVADRISVSNGVRTYHQTFDELYMNKWYNETSKSCPSLDYINSSNYLKIKIEGLNASNSFDIDFDILRLEYNKTYTSGEVYALINRNINFSLLDNYDILDEYQKLYNITIRFQYKYDNYSTIINNVLYNNTQLNLDGSWHNYNYSFIYDSNNSDSFYNIFNITNGLLEIQDLNYSIWFKCLDQNNFTRIYQNFTLTPSLSLTDYQKQNGDWTLNFTYNFSASSDIDQYNFYNGINNSLLLYTIYVQSESGWINKSYNYNESRAETFNFNISEFLTNNSKNQFLGFNIDFRITGNPSELDVDDMYLYDYNPQIPENCSIVINSGDTYTNSTSVNLTLSSIYASEMCFKNSTDDWTAWESYGTSKQLFLSDSTNNTEYTIFAKFKNAWGESDIVSDNIMYLLIVNCDGDSDNDGMPDDWEVSNGLDPLVNDSDEDPDGDGLSNLDEYNKNTDPNDSDSDDDGMPDGWEVSNGLDPLVNDSDEDPDGDGFSNLDEYNGGSDPNDSDDIPSGVGSYGGSDLITEFFDQIAEFLFGLMCGVLPFISVVMCLLVLQKILSDRQSKILTFSSLGILGIILWITTIYLFNMNLVGDFLGFDLINTFTATALVILIIYGILSGAQIFNLLKNTNKILIIAFVLQIIIGIFYLFPEQSCAESIFSLCLVILLGIGMLGILYLSKKKSKRFRK